MVVNIVIYLHSLVVGGTVLAVVECIGLAHCV